MPSPRINAFLASAGLGSRRSVEEFVREGRVTVNGEIIRNLAQRVDVANDRVVCDGREVRSARLRYVMLHKPRGYACTREDPHAKKTIYDLLPREFQNLAYAGRLDMESEGLLLLSNDGAWIQELTHPRHEVRKVYIVEVEGRVKGETLERVKQGVRSEDEWLKAESVEVLGSSPRVTRMKVVLKEGKNREIRRIFAVLGHRVLSLKREAMGKWRLGELRKGEWKELGAGAAGR